MDQKQFNKMIFILVLLAIVATVTSTILIFTTLSKQELHEEDQTLNVGSILLNVEGGTQEYASAGSITLNIANPEEEN